METRPSAIVGRRIRALRKFRELSARELAERLPMAEPLSRSTLAKIEAGQRDVWLHELYAIAYALGTSPLSLVIHDDIDETATIVEGVDATAGDLFRWWMSMGMPGREDSEDWWRDLQATRPAVIAEFHERLGDAQRSREALFAVMVGAAEAGDDDELLLAAKLLAKRYLAFGPADTHAHAELVRAIRADLRAIATQSPKETP